MWRGYEGSLAVYMMAICKEWRARGFKDNQLEWLDKWAQTKRLNFAKPHWLGDKDFHDSHRSNLLRKDPDWYSQFHWEVANDLPYVWPIFEKTTN
jgi:hypothetical protein